MENTIYINNAPVIIDVYAEVERKTFLIEIGDIADRRKVALLELYVNQNPNIEFIHECYGENKIQQVLDFITAYHEKERVYRESPEYKKLLEKRELLKKQETIKQYKRKFKIFFGFSSIICLLYPIFAFSYEGLTTMSLIGTIITGIAYLLFLALAHFMSKNKIMELTSS